MTTGAQGNGGVSESGAWTQTLILRIKLALKGVNRTQKSYKVLGKEEDRDFGVF